MYAKSAANSLHDSLQNGDYGEGIADRDENYIMWMPPENQKGDGTNALNEKFAGKY